MTKKREVIKKNEEIMRDKFHSIMEENFDEIPYFQDMEYEGKIDINKLIKHKKKHSFKGLKVASVLLAIILTSSLFTIIITNGSVEAGKDKIWNFLNSITGNEHMISDEEVNIVIENINDTENIEKAKDILPNLLIEEEIFGGYRFEHMSVDKFDKNNVFAVGLYTKDNKQLTYSYTLVDKNDSNIQLENPTKQESIDNGELFLTKNLNDEPGANSATYIKDDNMIEILGEVSLDELEKIMKTVIISAF